MDGVNQLMDCESESQGTSQVGEFFELPKAVSRHIKDCAHAHDADNPACPLCLKYLWIYVSDKGLRRAGDGPHHHLSSEEWLGVVDEAASLGAHCLVLCVEGPLGAHPEVWKLCRWAQEAYAMHVGIYIFDGTPSEADVKELTSLDKSKTCLLVDSDHEKTVQFVEDLGIRVCPADVDPQEQCPPCDLPQSVICVGAEGVMYTCGLVLGDNRFNLGHISDKPLEAVVNDDSLPHTIPGSVTCSKKGCSACPPIMAKRVLEGHE